MVRGVQKIRDHEARKLTRTDADIKQAVKAWCREWGYDNSQRKGVCKVPGDPVAAEAQYGHISEWRTEQVTDMGQLFENMSEFNEDLSRWDVSAVTNMYCMFYDASSFNQDLSAWDVSAVTDMRNTFWGASMEANCPRWYTPGLR